MLLTSITPKPLLWPSLWIALTLATLVLLPSHGAFGEDLVSVYQNARDNDPILAAAQASFAATRERVPQARARLLPNVTGSANRSETTRDLPGATLATGQAIPSEKFFSHGWNAQLRQSLFDMPSWFALGGAKASVRAAEFELEAQRQDLIVRVLQAYLNVLRAQDRLDTTNAEVTAVQRQLEQVQQRFEVGLVAITDVLESQAAFDNTEVRRIQAISDLEIAFETLTTLTGSSFERLDRLSETLPIVNPDPFDESAWVDTALSSNLAIRAAAEQLAASRKDVNSKRSEHLPTIAATATQSHNVSGGANFFNSDTTDTSVYGVQITMPIYAGGLTRSRNRESSARVTQAEEQLRNQQLTVTRDTRNLFLSVTTDVVRVKARLRAIKSAQSALDATETGYEVGTRNIVDVLQAQQRLFGSQFDYADSRYNYVLNLMRLRQATGGLSATDLEQLNLFTDAENPVVRIFSLTGRQPSSGG